MSGEVRLSRTWSCMPTTTLFLGIVGWVHDRERSPVSATTARLGATVDNCWHGDTEGAGDSSQRPRCRHLQRLWKASMFVCCQEAGQRGGRKLWSKPKKMLTSFAVEAFSHQTTHWQARSERGSTSAAALTSPATTSPASEAYRSFASSVAVPVPSLLRKRFHRSSSLHILCAKNALQRGCVFALERRSRCGTWLPDGDWLSLDTEMCMIPAKKTKVCPSVCLWPDAVCGNWDYFLGGNYFFFG